MKEDKELIRIEHLAKSFGDNLVLRDISISIKEGEKVVIIGPSGSGKSTFLRCMNLLETPTGGKIWFEGERKPRGNPAGLFYVSQVSFIDALHKVQAGPLRAGLYLISFAASQHFIFCYFLKRLNTSSLAFSEASQHFNPSFSRNRPHQYSSSAMTSLISGFLSIMPSSNIQSMVFCHTSSL